jgi:lipoprotein NlpD
MKITRLILILLTSLLLACAGPPPKPRTAGDGNLSSQNSTPDGYYRVRRGDSLIAIAFKFGLDWREIARLNGISDPYIIHPDQLLRLSADGRTPASTSSTGKSTSNSAGVKTTPIASPGTTTTKTLDTPRSSTTTIDSSQSAGDNSPQPPADAGKPPAENQAQAKPAGATQAPSGSEYTTPAGDPARWLWPTEGRLLSSFQANDPARKGIDIGGKAGQAVVASAAGQVVYSGSGLLGYGELVIIKHSDRILSAYAHNSKRLVSEGQQVTAGSQIAEMGTNDRNQAELHFEIRVNGTPQDPLKYLPKK